MVAINILEKEERIRGAGSTIWRNQGKELFKLKDKDELQKHEFSGQFGAYGKLWAQKIKNDYYAMPSIDEMLDGIQMLFSEFYEAKLSEAGELIEINMVKESIWMAFQQIKQCIGYKRTDLPLKEAQDDENGFNSDSNFCNPYSKITCLILYLLSMDLGSPPLYHTLNKANREMNESMLEKVGPLARGIGKILINAELYRKDKDKIEPGFKSEGVDMNMAGAFIVFKGARISP